MNEQQLNNLKHWLKQEADKAYELFLNAEEDSAEEDEQYGRHNAFYDVLDKLKTL